MKRIGLLALAVLVGLSSAWAGEPERTFTLEEMNRIIERERTITRLYNSELSVPSLNGFCDSVDVNDLFICHIVIEAVLHTHEILVSARPDLKAYCAPPDLVRPKQARGMFILWVKKNKDSLLLPAAFGVIFALRAAWPCKR